jgi:hypothetical protein
MWKPDCVLLIAEAVAELIKSKPRSPSRYELQMLLRGGYFAYYVVTGGGSIENSREAIEELVADRTDPLIALINAQPRSPTVHEIRDVLLGRWCR